MIGLDEGFWQWCSIAVLMCIAVSTLVLSLQNARLSKEVHQTINGKVDLIANTYADIFKGMLERVSDAMNSDDNLDKVK